MSRREFEVIKGVVTAPSGAAATSNPAHRVQLRTDNEPGFEPGVARTGHLLSEMRALRRRVLEATAAVRDSGRAAVVMVTSAVPGDGKSFTSFHLALSLTREKGLNVTLVDGDVARQQVSRLFEPTESAGLSGWITGQVGLSRVWHATSIPGLNFVPAGERTEDAAECMASSRWDDIMEEMHRCDSSNIFVLDTAPILATSEAQYAARNVDLLLFVVRAEVTPQQAVDQTLQRLGDVSKVGFVFNGAAPISPDDYYDYSDYGMTPKARS